jgi:hypothetical protein
MAEALVPSDLTDLESAYRKCPTDINIQQKILSLLRLNRMRRPDLVMKIGPYLLKKARGRMPSNTVWDIREQVGQNYFVAICFPFSNCCDTLSKTEHDV